MKNQITFILIFVFLIAGNLRASKLIVSTDIGFDPIDNTSFLQFALDETTEDTIVIDNVNGMDWNTGPLEIKRENITIIFEEGVVVRALPGVFDVFESLFRVNDKSNIKFLGYGATLIMNRQEYIDLADSEFRHGISLNSATNVLIEGLTILDTGGDGVIITKSFQPGSQQNYCENITIRNCRFSNNYRQGLSITSARNVDILNCEFSETSGTLPEDGIDIEPDAPDERIENVLIKGCRIFNNFGNAIQIALFMMDDSSLDISVTVQDTYMANNHDPTNSFAFAEIAATDNGDNGVDGFVNFINCYIDHSDWTAVYASKTVESFEMNFTNCVFKNISNDPIDLNNPIFLEVTDYENPVPRFGGLNFFNCAIIYDENIPFFNLIGNPATSPGLGNITGNFYVFNPNDAGFNVGTNPNNVNITYEYFSTFPTTEINLSATQLDYLEQDQFIQFEIQRADQLDIPLAVEFDYSGTAQYGMDYNRARGFKIIPPNSLSIIDTLEIVQDIENEDTEILELSLVGNDCVEVGNDSLLIFSINEIITSTSPEQELEDLNFKVFPNPTKEMVQIESLVSNFEVEIFNVKGQVIKIFKNQNSTLNIDLNQFPSGQYFIVIKNKENDKTVVRKLIKQ